MSEIEEASLGLSRAFTVLAKRVGMMLHFAGKKEVKERQEKCVKRKEKQKGDVNLLYFDWIISIELRMALRNMK